MRQYAVVLAFLVAGFLAFPLRGMGQETPAIPPQDEETPDGQPPATAEPPLTLQNEEQQDKATRLHEASGVPEEEIVRMRLGETPVPTVGEQDEDRPQGRGWGVICRWLGIHPGTLGGGRGNKFSHPSEQTGEQGLLERRRQRRHSRLFGWTRDRDAEEGAEHKEARSQEKEREKEAMAGAERGRALGRDKGSGEDGASGSNGRGKDRSDKGNRGKGKGRGNSGGKGKN
jgi:hypothetical protein